MTLQQAYAEGASVCRCIGCRNCTNSAPSTFFIVRPAVRLLCLPFTAPVCNPVPQANQAVHEQEDEYGRARVHAQWGDEEDAIREAVDMCPVSAACVNTRT